MNLDIALDELPTGTRDELCVQAFTQAREDIEKLHAAKRQWPGYDGPHPSEDRALLAGNGERQGERGFPLGRARGPAATEKRGEGDPIPVGAFSHRQSVLS